MKSEDMHEDLRWLAENVSEWRFHHFGLIRYDRHDNLARWCDESNPLLPRSEYYTKAEWQAAREQLANEAEIKPETEPMTEEEEREYGPEPIAHDNVNHPKHYQIRPGYEVYDLRQDLAKKAASADVPHSQYSDWDRAIEYLLRCWEKNGVEDAKKARWYLDKLIKKMEPATVQAGGMGK